MKHRIVIITALLIKITTNQRFGLSQAVLDHRLKSVHLISQHYSHSRIFCFLNCFNIASCLSFAIATSNQCFLYMSDYRLASEQNSSLLETEKQFSLFVINLENGLFCAELTDRSTLTDDEKCLLGLKICEK